MLLQQAKLQINHKPQWLTPTQMLQKKLLMIWTLTCYIQTRRSNTFCGKTPLMTRPVSSQHSLTSSSITRWTSSSRKASLSKTKSSCHSFQIETNVLSCLRVMEDVPSTFCHTYSKQLTYMTKSISIKSGMESMRSSRRPEERRPCHKLTNGTYATSMISSSKETKSHVSTWTGVFVISLMTKPLNSLRRSMICFM